MDRVDQLLYAVDVLQQSQIIAVDSEFTQIRTREQGGPSHRLALVQLAVKGHCFVVDALRLNDLSPLATLMADPEYCVLLHGAGADLRVMSERGLQVAHYMDLEAASRSIFGQHESSLAVMLQRALNIRLDKSLQRTDWTRRPLPPAMVAYAARDAEMTLALYTWLEQHYSWALRLHEHWEEEGDPVAEWIEPFLRGTAQASPEVTMAEAQQQGLLSDDQIRRDCRQALQLLVSPMRRSRLLRLIADLSLVELVPDMLPLLQAVTSDERSATLRALGRMDAKQSFEQIQPLLNDPVQDVRKAAQTALRNLSDHESHVQLATPSRRDDGSRSWTVGETEDTDDASDWKARLRAMMEP